MKVLVADDEPFVRTTLSMLLRLEGYQVVVAADGRAALESAMADPPELILSDMHMPHMSGRALLAAVRSAAVLSQTRFVFLTGEVQAAVATDTDGAGPDGFLTKPFSREQLLALLVALGIWS